jgi:MYND finger
MNGTSGVESTTTEGAGSLQKDVREDAAITESSAAKEKELENAVEYFIENEELPWKWIERNMPQHTMELRDGILKADDCFRSLKMRLDETIFKRRSEAREEGFDEAAWDPFVNWFYLLQDDAEAIVTKALFIKSFETICSKDNLEKAFQYMAVRMAYSLSHSEVGLLLLEAGRLGAEQLSTMNAVATNHTCEKVANYMDKTIFRGKRGRFIKKTPVYKKPRGFFRDLLLFNKTAYIRETRKMRLRFCLSNLMHVAKGDGRAHKMCWGCTTRLSKTIKFCTSCQVANYCGRECQVRHWKSEHKLKCGTLKQIHQLYEDQLAVLKSCFESDLEKGLTPFYLFDFKMMQYCLLVEPCRSPWKGTALEGRLMGPCISFYFENLRRVHDNQLWLVTEDQEHENLGWTPEDELFHLEFHKLLCYDYMRYLERHALLESSFHETFPFPFLDAYKERNTSRAGFLREYEMLRDALEHDPEAEPGILQAELWKMLQRWCHRVDNESFSFLLCHHPGYA